MFRSVRLLIEALLLVTATAVPASPVHAGEAMTAGLVSQVDPGYRLGAEDIMLVSVWKD